MSLIALALAAAIAAKPLVDANEADVRCVAALALVIGQQGEKPEPGLAAGLLYFMGRLDGRAPGTDIEGMIRSLLAAPDATEQLKPDMIRCGALLEERGAFLEKMGKSLQDAN